MMRGTTHASRPAIWTCYTTMIHAGMHLVKFAAEGLKKESVPKIATGEVKLADPCIAWRSWRIAGQDAIEETSIAKFIGTENNFRCAALGLQILGGAGYSMEYGMQMFFRDSHDGPIGGSSSEIQRNMLARRMGL